jgi:hypothetical protein
MDGMHMVQREQDGINKAFLMALMREQQENESNGIVIDLREKPQIEGDNTLASLARRVVEEATTVTPRGMAQDVLSRAGIDSDMFTGVPEITSGHLRHVGRRAKKVSVNQNKIRVRRAVKSAQSRPALGQENVPRKKARRIAR